MLIRCSMLKYMFPPMHMGARIKLRIINLRNSFSGRRRYEKLSRPVSSGKKVKIIKLHGGSDSIKGKKVWRFRLISKLRIAALFPAHVLHKIRDAYVKLMMAVASKEKLSGLAVGYHGVAVGKEHAARAYRPLNSEEA